MFGTSHRFRSAFVLASALLTFSTPMFAQEYSILVDQQTGVPSRSNGLPASIDGLAFDVSIVDGFPSAAVVTTEFPVLRYAGRSADGRRFAYTTLDAFDEGSPLHRRPVKSTDAGAVLVPTGDLLVEHARTHAVRRVDLDGQYVVRAAWSATKPHELAYTFASDAGEFGLAIANVWTGKVTVVRDRGILADYLAWGADGVEFYERDGILPAADPGFEVEHFRPAVLDVASTVKKASAPLRELPAAEERLTGPQGFTIRIGSLTLTGDALAGPGSLELRSTTGTLIESFEAPLIEAISADGVLLKAIDAITGNDQLLFISADGKITPIMSGATTTNYYLAYSSGTKVTVTQSGSGYSPSCGVWDHTGSMAYAYDFQSAEGYSDAILASASGTIAYIKKTITCNSLDKNSCTDYRYTCTGSTSNYGFGNVVVIGHADGRYTAYAHLRYGSVKPTTTGVSVERGCKLGNQGHTGATIGDRNGCGDHLHEQRQTGISVQSSSSIALNFASLTNPLGCSYGRYTAGATYKLCF